MPKCKHCKTNIPKDKGVLINLKRFCDFTCAAKFGKDNIPKGNEIKRKEQKKADKAKLQKLKTAGEYTKEAQAAVNRYIRARDYGKPCISCGTPHQIAFGGKFDCGHYRSRGSASHLRFNLLNMAGQCVKCNRNLSGNVIEYRINLINKIGIDRVERLETDNAPRKFTIEYLQRVKKIFNKRARWYEKRINNKTVD